MTTLPIVYDGVQQPELDIVSIPAIPTLTPQQKSRDQNQWLRQVLSHQIPRARIMAFQYGVTSEASDGNDGLSWKALLEHAIALLIGLTIRREGVEQRPIVFVCHSFGAFIVKKVLYSNTTRLDEESAVNLLMTMSRFKGDKLGDDERKEELEAAGSIVKRIDCLPLAIMHAANLILSDSCMFSEFLEAYINHRIQLCHLSEGVEKAKDLALDFFGSAYKGNKLKTQILRSSLMTQGENHKELRIHRLVQESCHLRMDAAERRESFNNALIIVKQCWPVPPRAAIYDPALWDAQQALLLHYCLCHLDKGGGYRILADIYSGIGSLHTESNMFQEAYDSFRKEWDYIKLAFDTGELQRPSAWEVFGLARLGNGLHRLNWHQEAEGYYYRALEAWKGPPGDRTALRLAEDGKKESEAKYKEAMETHLQSLKLYTLTIGPRHYRTADTYHKVGWHFHRWGNYAAAFLKDR
ncbi:hypothetical protein B0T24DRAFT_669725 [Lasiosphaeria ovina]|uniref:DUF7779 domain-containing protein n=1 Tax=Lasiosphaeria ovina TaxID=92902 RepID=A0AAE0JW38_9PEZI|nr:hypothetical protein B0T24DRAFT_669725 [Lasiosphaeria ovina]